MPSTIKGAALLASVRDEGEARLAVALGADIIDAKDPARGALGALDEREIGRIRAAVPRAHPVSATTGDHACEPEIVCAAARRIAACGVDFVKIGLFPGADRVAAIRAAGRLDLAGARLIGVLLADRSPDPDLLAVLAESGFAGVMLDTADKASGPLTRVLPAGQIEAFVALARSHGLLVGLAGSLRVDDVASLLAMRPDILGFRGALCRARNRTATIDADAFAAVRSALPRARIAFPSERAQRLASASLTGRPL